MCDRIEFDSERREYRVGYDPEATAPSVAVIDVVRTVFDDNCDSRPLYEVVDPDALDGLLESRSNRDRRDPISVSFTYASVRVTVTSDGRITVRPIADGRTEGDGDR